MATSDDWQDEPVSNEEEKEEPPSYDIFLIDEHKWIPPSVWRAVLGPLLVRPVQGQDAQQEETKEEERADD